MKLGSPQCLVVQRWDRINTGSTVTLTFVPARFLVSFKNNRMSPQHFFFSQHSVVLRELSGREYARITNTFFYEFIIYVTRTYYRCENSCETFTEVKDSHVLITTEKFARILHMCITTFEFFTLVTDSFDFHIQTNLPHV